MGGTGSGGWYRWNAKETTESQHRIDIHWLKKNDYLRDGISGTCSWSRGGREVGRIGFKIEKHQMVLTYRSRHSDQEWESIEQRIAFDYTRCHYGGRRTWFLCSGCGQRVAILYGGGKYFLCRHCCNLTYGSQQENRMDRSFRKAANIRERLGGNGRPFDLFPWKPKYMHWKTYWQLKEKATKSEQQGWYALSKQGPIIKDKKRK